MFTRNDFENRENEYLASYAAKSSESYGRLIKEEEDNLRTCFQHDRDRIIHSKAFRRLKHKAQVFIKPDSDHFRSRLTHTLEVAQISRSMARNLGLNEDLAEAIALAHDLGHPPCGHAGEDILNELMKDEGGFDHNEQSFRVVTILESKHPSYQGLNLTGEVLNGLRKKLEPFLTLEAEMVDMADEIAYNAHDIDDGFAALFLDDNIFKEVSLLADINNLLIEKYPDHNPTEKKYLIVSTFIDLAIQNLVHTSEENIQKAKIKNKVDREQFYANTFKSGGKLIDFQPSFKQKIIELKKYLMKNIYTSQTVLSFKEQYEELIVKMFDYYLKNPQLMKEIQFIDINSSPKRKVCDYISGMTDDYLVKTSSICL